MMHPPKRPSSKVQLRGFREEASQYTASQGHWERLFMSVAKERSGLIWKEWLKDPFREGQPIFSRVSKEIGKGVAINQVLPADDSVELRAWMSVFGSEDYGDAVTTLNISCMLIDEIDACVKELLQEFIVKERPYEFMKKLCEEYTHSSIEVA